MAFSIQGMAPLLQVFDMPASLRFYRDQLGFQVTQQAPSATDDCDWVSLHLSGVDLMLNTAYEKDRRPSTPDVTRMASHSDITIYFGAPDVDAVYSHILEQGIKAKKPAITGYGFKALNLTDPDGYNICFHWPA